MNAGLRLGLVVLLGAVGTSAIACRTEKSDDKKTEKDKKSEKGKDKKKSAAFGSSEPIQDGPGGTPEADSYLADTGFRPGKHGLSYQNGDRDGSGNSISYPETSKGHLDDDGVYRLFGSAVCLGD